MCQECFLAETSVQNVVDLCLDTLKPGGELGQLGEWFRGDQRLPGVAVAQEPVTHDLDWGQHL